MPSLKQTRGKRATPIAITAEKGPWSEWLKLNTLKSNSLSTIASPTMSYADPIIAPEHSMAPQMPRPLTFFDLPTETQKEVVQHCTTTDLVSLSLVSRYFRDLAAAQIYRNFHIVFPDDDDNSYESDLDGLAAGLDTFATSEYDYARYLKEIILETLSGGAKGERACRQYTNDLSCGKFMNTLFLLTLRRAKALETFKWDVRIELSRPVYKALHNIPALQHLYLRMHSGTSIYQSPPPLQSLGLPPTTNDVTKNVAGLLTYLKAGGSTKGFQEKSSLTLPGNDLSNGHGPPTISGFKNLKSLSVLDMDSLEYISELKTCIRKSSSTLNKLELSFSESLARQARRPPPVDDTGDDSDQEVDEFGNMIPPPPAVALPSTDDVGGPAKTLTAQEAKKAQEAVLGRIFGLETASNPKLKTKDEDTSSSSVSDEEKEADSEFESAGKEFIKDLGSLSRKLMFAVNGPTRTQQQKDLLNIIGKAAKKYVAEKRETRIGTAGKSGSMENSTAGSSTAKATPVSSSAASAADKADEEDTPKGSEPEEKSAGLFDEEAKKPRKTNQHSTDSSNPDDIDIYEPEEGPDSHESETGSASDSFVAEAVDIAKLAQQTVTSNGLSEEAIVAGENFTQPRVSKDLEAKQSNSVGLVVPSSLTSDTRVDEGTGQNDKFSSEEKGKTSSPLLSENSPDNARHAMNEYVRTTHGLTLKTLAIYLIPIRTSVLSRAVDFHVLRRISLLNVGPQTSFWNHLAKENAISPLPLCKIHTDNVTMPFLNFVNQLDNLVELFILERTTKSSEYSFAPKTTVTNDNIRRLVLKKHISSLKRLVIKNENDYTWDANERFIELLCRKGKKLEELGISFGSLAMHTFDQYLPGLVSLRALHIINFRNDDTCHWVMREVRKFIVDVVSNHPNMKLVYLALGGSVERLVWQIPKIKSKAAFKLKDKGKGKATISGIPTTGSESPFPSLEAAMMTADKVDYSSSDESDGDDDYTPGLKLETIDNGRFYDVYSVHMWKKDVLLGRL